MALTGPWGHAGAFDSLEDVVRHHLDPIGSLNRYVPSAERLPPLGRVVELTAEGSTLHQSWLSENRQQGFLARDARVQKNPMLRQRIADANELDSMTLSDQEMADLVAFLNALTDPDSLDLASLVPAEVPSGLPVED